MPHDPPSRRRPGDLVGRQEKDREELIEMLKQAYWMEMESVINYTTTPSTQTVCALEKWLSRTETVTAS
jgi:hypothetical protein